MRMLLVIIAAIGVSALISASVLAQELLTNPGLELVPPDEGGRDSVAPGWTTDEGPPVPRIPNQPGDYNDSGFVDAADYVVWRKGGPLANEGASPIGIVNALDYNFWVRRFGLPLPLSMSEPSNFGHLLYEGDWQHWFQPYLGTEAQQQDNYAHLTQTVPGTPGLQYTMTGYALFENYFPGGVTNLNAANPDGTATGAPFDDGPLSPTDTYFGLDFLNSSGEVLAGSVEVELKANGQPSNTTWFEHTLVGTAPAATTHVRVRATMLDGVFNPLPYPQIFQMSFFVDAFSLTAAPGSGGGAAVPEPATWLLGTVAAGVLGAFRRQSRLAPMRRS